MVLFRPKSNKFSLKHDLKIDFWALTWTNVIFDKNLQHERNVHLFYIDIYQVNVFSPM